MIKKILNSGKLLMVPVIILSLSLTVSAQDNNKFSYDPAAAVPGFLAGEQVPDASRYLPGPPDTSSAAFLADMERHAWGKSLRSTARGKLAISDAVHSTADILDGFEDAFGMRITKEKSPRIFELCDRVNTDAYAGVEALKDKYMRPRPFVFLEEGTPIPQSEEAYAPTGSYPSGHSVRGWAIALVLAEINPARQEEILLRGLDYGDSRVIVGYHWQSDVDVARTAGGAVVARLHADREFARAMKKAKREFARIVRGDNLPF